MQLTSHMMNNLKDPWWRLTHLYKITTKDSKVVTFEPNKVQAKFLRRKSNKNVILKARQMGMSTAIILYLLDKTIFNENQNTVIIAHRKEDVEKLFRKVKFAFEQMPEFCKPVAKYATKQELYFEQINSRIEVSLYTRGDTIHNLHVSELGFIQDAANRMLATLQAVPDSGEIFFESTANGVGNYFYEVFNKATRRENDFKAHFYAWFEDDSYVSKRKIELLSEDLEAGTKYSLTKDQLQWRRWKIRDIGNTRTFLQEFPEDSRGCFLSSGSPVFHIEQLDRLVPRATEPKRGIVVDGIFEKDLDGWAYIWEGPDKHSEYVIGVDVAEGGKSDSSVAIVLKRKPLKVVAKIYGKMDPDHLGNYVAELIKYYNDAYTGVEINGPGMVTCLTLERMEEGLPLYRQKVYDDIKQQATERVGWRTNGATKPLVVEGLVAVLRDEMMDIPDIQIINECFTYERDRFGRTNAPSGAHDDHVMALAIALQMHQESGEVLSYTEKKQLDAEQEVAKKIWEKVHGEIASENGNDDPHLGSEF